MELKFQKEADEITNGKALIRLLHLIKLLCLEIEKHY